VAAAGFPADFAASLFQELVIAKWLINWMTKEAANPDELCNFVETFTTMRQLSEDGLVALSHEARHSLSQVFDKVSTTLAAVAAVAEVKVVVGNIRAVDAVKVVTSCKAGRSGMGVVSAILKDKTWNPRVSRFWTTMVAEVTHKPKVAQVLDGLSKPAGAEAWASAVESLPIWLAELPREVTCKVESAMLTWLTARVREVKDVCAAREVMNWVRQAKPVLKDRLEGVLEPTRELFVTLEARARLDAMLISMKALKDGIDTCKDLSLMTAFTEARR
jgi:hypothetical protein